MTKITAINLIKLRLGSREDTDLNTLIEAELQQAQWQKERDATKLWFNITEDASTSTVAGERRVPVPLDFLQETEDSSLWLVNGATIAELRKESADTAYGYYGETQGVPTHYSLLNDVFQLYPIPEAVYTLKMQYFASDTDITTLADGETNRWLTYAADLLMGLAGTKVARYIKDAEAAAAFQAEAAEAWKRLIDMNVVQGETNFERFKGEL